MIILAPVGNNSMWEKFVQRQTNRWRDMIKNWLISTKKHPVLVVKYEDLKTNTLYEVGRMLSFLDIQYDSEELREKLDIDLNAFHRKHQQEEFDHFTDQQRTFINEVVKELIPSLKNHNKLHILNVDHYVSELY